MGANRNGIKAIETIYKGYKFRSRLEARWAVFFDSLGIPWEYEKEGYDLNGRWYLPDFYLPEIDTWIEIKPGDIDEWPDHVVFDNWPESDEEWELWPFKNFVVIVGTPYTNLENQYASYSEWSYCGYIRGDCYYRFCECPGCGKIGIEFDGRAGRICGSNCCGTSDKSYNTHSDRLINAYLKARQARFEHGEKG